MVSRNGEISREKLIDEIRQLVSRKAGKNRAILYDEDTGWQTGVRCFYFSVIGMNGVHSGHYVDEKEIPRTEKRIIADMLSGHRIIS